MRIISRDDGNLLHFASAVEFSNRLLMTVTPQREHTRGCYHLGLVALDFDQVSDTDGIGGDGRPVWEGLWTGLQIYQIITGLFNGVTRCFAIADSESEASYMIFELTKDQAYDEGFTTSDIEWSIETPPYHFDKPGIRKELQHARFWLRDLQGEATVALSFAADDYPVWQTWDTHQLCAASATCAAVDCSPTPTLPQPRNPIIFRMPTRTCQTGQPVLNTRGYTSS